MASKPLKFNPLYNHTRTDYRLGSGPMHMGASEPWAVSGHEGCTKKTSKEENRVSGSRGCHRPSSFKTGQGSGWRGCFDSGMNLEKRTWYQRPRVGLSKTGQNFANNPQNLKYKLKDLEINDETRQQRIKNATCYRCQEKGHFAWNCIWKRNKTRNLLTLKTPWKKPAKPLTKTNIFSLDFMVNGTENGSWNNIWYVNSSISKHMTPRKDLFEYSKDCIIHENKKGCSYTIHGIGQIKVPTNESLYLIPYVSHVSKIHFNLLSKKQLILQGFEIEINGSSCKLTHMNDPGRYKEKEIEDEASVCGKFKNVQETFFKVDSFAKFVDFMDFINCEKLVYKYNKEVKAEINQVLTWFHMNHSEKDIASRMPPRIANMELCLFELFRLVKHMGGYNMVTLQNEWYDVAMSFGYPANYDIEFCLMYKDLLLQPILYHNQAKEDRDLPIELPEGLGTEAIDHPVWFSDHIVAITDGNNVEIKDDIENSSIDRDGKEGTNHEAQVEKEASTGTLEDLDDFIIIP